MSIGSSLTSSQEFVIDKNNQAVSLINANTEDVRYYSEAIDKLVQALNELEHSVVTSPESFHQIATTRSWMEQLANANSSAPSDTGINNMFRMYIDCGRESETYRMWLFSLALRLPTFNMSVEADQVTTASIIIFNSALAFHLLGTRNTSRIQNLDAGEAFLQRAQMLYKLALHLNRDTQNEQDQSDYDSIFPLAIVNNLGLLQYQLHQNEQFREFFELLLSMLMVLAVCGKDLSPPGYVGFVRNAAAIFLYRPNILGPSASSAAA